MMLADVGEEGVGLPTACQLDDVVRVACGGEEGGTANPEGVAMDAESETGLDQRRTNGVKEGLPMEGKAWAQVEGRVGCRASRDDAKHVGQGSPRTIERAGEAEVDVPGNTRLRTRETECPVRSTVSRVPARAKVAALRLPCCIKR